MANKHKPKSKPNQATTYEIRLKGHINRQWKDWFGGGSITPKDNGETLLTIPVIDQAALHGLLRKIRDLGMPLLSINCDQPEQADTPEPQQFKQKKSKGE